MADSTGSSQVLNIDSEVQMLLNNRKDGYNWQERRRDQWNENYTLARDRVVINRLIQRQSVNIPLMRLVLKTLMKDIDDMPVILFENLKNDKQKEVFYNEYWKYTGEKANKFEIQDIVDKKQVFFYGRSFDQWQIVNGKVKFTIVDPIDILVSRYMDPTNIHSSRYLIHENIFIPLAQLKANKDLDQGEVSELEKFFATEQGLIKLSDNERRMQEKNEKMKDMGVPDVDNPVLGEVIVECALHFVYRPAETVKTKNKDGKEEEVTLPEQIWVYLLAENMRKLMKKPLEEVIGQTKDHFWQNHFPYNTWADDVDNQDVWSDGIADGIRTLNKVLNSWFSQWVENRTLRNFGMNYYDATAKADGWTPPTVNPAPWAWIPLPGKPGEVFQKVDIPELSQSPQEMTFVMEIAEKLTGATPTKQGVQTQTRVTLGEVELALNEANERIKGMSKFYTQVWKERALMFIKLLEAAGDKIDAVTVEKNGRNTNNIYTKEIAPSDWMDDAGYTCEVWSRDEKNQSDAQKIERLNAIVATIPGNPKLEEIRKREMLEFAGLTPEEINEVMEIEKQKMQFGVVDPMTGLPMGQPTQPLLPLPQAPQGVPAQ